MKQRDIARLGAGKRGDHVVEPDHGLPALVIGIFDGLEPDRADDRRMVGPARGSEQHARVRVDGRDQLESEPKRTAAAGSLQTRNALSSA